MAYSTHRMKMIEPNSSPDFWANILDLGKTLAPWSTIGVVLWNAINKTFKYFSDSRDAELRDIVKKEVKPQLDELTKKIEELSKNIWELQSRVK